VRIGKNEKDGIGNIFQRRNHPGKIQKKLLVVYGTGERD